MRTVSTLFVLLSAVAAAHGAPAPKAKPVMEAALHVRPPIVATGMPVPRWVTVKASEMHLRQGPSLEAKILWKYVKPGIPVEVIAEYNAWRRVRDADGVTGWVHASLLDGRRNVVVTGRVNTAILREPKADAAAIAYAAPGLVARLVGCQGEWCEVSSRGYDGFVARDRLFGVYEHETVR